MSNNNKLYFLLFSLLFPVFLFKIFGQHKDTIYGKVFSVRETLKFLDEDRQTYKLYETDGDYGHYGFINPKKNNAKFYSLWYHSPWAHYTNYYKEFDKEGNKRYEIWYYKNLDIAKRYRYIHDDNGLLIQKKTSYDNDDYVVTNYTYDKYKNLKTTIYYESESPNEYGFKRYLYQNLNLINIINYAESGTIYRSIFEYDDRGRKIKMYAERNYNNLVDKIKTEQSANLKLAKVYKYNSNDMVVEEISYDYDLGIEHDLRIRSKIKNYYEMGALKKVEEFYKNRLSNTTYYEYDERERVIRQQTISAKYKKNNKELKYSYNNEGYISKLFFKRGLNEPKKIKIEYVFDKHKNWTKQTKYLDGEKLFVWKRNIHYYD